MSRSRALLTTLALFAVEVFIACCTHDRFVRPFVGDVLVVPLLYCAARVVVRRRPFVTACAALAFAYLVEALQAIDYVALLHLEHHGAISIIMGRTFEWTDLVAYTFGFGCCVAGRHVPGQLAEGGEAMRSSNHTSSAEAPDPTRESSRRRPR